MFSFIWSRQERKNASKTFGGRATVDHLEEFIGNVHRCYWRYWDSSSVLVSLQLFHADFDSSVDQLSLSDDVYLHQSPLRAVDVYRYASSWQVLSVLWCTTYHGCHWRVYDVEREWQIRRGSKPQRGSASLITVGANVPEKRHSGAEPSETCLTNVASNFSHILKFYAKSLGSGKNDRLVHPSLNPPLAAAVVIYLSGPPPTLNNIICINMFICENYSISRLMW